MNEQSLLQAENLHVYYGKSHILHGVSLNVRRGEVVCLLGRNGAGKTTTIKGIMGLAARAEGTVTIAGKRAERLPPHGVARLGVGYVPEGRKIFPHLTVEENLAVPVNRPGRWNLAEIYKFFPRLHERRRHPGGMLSGGEQEMLAVGRALITNPDLFIMDEPSQGLAPKIVQEIYALIQEMVKDGQAVLLAEQNAFMALEISSRAYVIDNGQIVFDGMAQELLEDKDRVRALAGASV
ncbi:ABC transporter ATP-binding protein [Acidihalobacter prosperus]|uniref:Branched-chain amino acid transport ATP-binding protein LivF n=1 Tax=Acidihalobacter prosperus TaxID=160660 RepID=A0A1A6C4E5_9GAMM|nr:ABC transporter ATP-binding protein [Acidihalobacter prosperus]OBS09424.1 Branched-chain amino acid transport ATP-binding protein LivF [Acidihalobacter prosperus]